MTFQVFHDQSFLGTLFHVAIFRQKDIRVWIGIAKNVFIHLKPILTGGLRQATKKKLVKTLVWSVATYAAETWTINKADKQRVEAIEMKIWSKMEKVKWTDKLINEEVLSQFNESRGLMAHIKRRKSRWIGHILRHKNLLRNDLVVFHLSVLLRRFSANFCDAEYGLSIWIFFFLYAPSILCFH